MPLREVKFEPDDVKKLFKQPTPTRWFFKQTKKFAKNLLLILIVFGAAFVLINYSAFYQRTSYALQNQPDQPAPASESQPVAEPTVDYAPEIKIPKLGINAPIIFDVTSDQTVEVLRTGVAHQFATAKPGELGNVVLIGHSSDFPWSTGQY